MAGLKATLFQMSPLNVGWLILEIGVELSFLVTKGNPFQLHDLTPVYMVTNQIVRTAGIYAQRVVFPQGQILAYNAQFMVRRDKTSSPCADDSRKSRLFYSLLRRALRV